MILLDTNVISEVMRPLPSATVLNWLNEQNTATLFLSSVTIAEIYYGLGALPRGRRFQLLNAKFERFVAEAFEGRILSFDKVAAKIYGEVMAHRKNIGRPLTVPDGQIVSIARSHAFSIATRNVKDFQDSGVDVINPFIG